MDNVYSCDSYINALSSEACGPYLTICKCCRVVKFSSLHHLTLYFPTNFGSETTKVYYIGLRGEFSEAHRHGVTICTYEARPNVSDHKTNAFDSVSHEVQ
jgi:hypothetical protein